MQEISLAELFELKKPQLDEWGKRMAAVLDGFVHQFRPSYEFDALPAVPISYRVKTTKSFLGKIIRKGPYEDPFQDITDLVGARIVLLLERDVEWFSTRIREYPKWNVLASRDYQIERERTPTHFDYQSKHFIVSSNEAGVEVSGEIQVRTLLQHAYAELAHNRIYKPDWDMSPDPTVRRTFARCMALIETADEAFTRVSQGARSMGQFSDSDWLEKLYRVVGEPDVEPHLTAVLGTALADLIGNISEEELTSFIGERGFVVEKIGEKSQSRLLYRQPLVLALYYLAANNHIELQRAWPLSRTELEPVYADIGRALSAE